MGKKRMAFAKSQKISEVSKTKPPQTHKCHEDSSSSKFALKVKKGSSAVGVRFHRRKKIDNMFACRHELKYRISESMARAVDQFIKPYLHPDRYAKLQADGTYPIVSLYFDSAALNLCRETIEGKKNRFKLRIRSYSDDLQAPRFFEIKRRINNIIVKSRSRVRQEDVEPVIGQKSLILPADCSDAKTLSQFQLYLHSLNAKPVVLVRYLRQAFEGDSDNRVRITLDRQLSYKIMREPKIIFSGSDWHRVAMEFVILEIKFTARYPVWLTQMVKTLNLKQTAISKYVESVKQSCSMGFCAPQILV
jgi:SPX domain protein involved in polyphosphate accumulation